MQQYHDLLRHILAHGTEKTDRTGTGTLSVFGYQMRFDLQDGFPLLTTKKVHFKSIVHELIWFLRGDTNIRYLTENGVSIWDEWADEHGELGPVYGKQWRSWAAPDGRVIDQMSDVIRMLRTNPDSRRMIVSAWNPADVPSMALPPCHALFQFYTRPLKARPDRRQLFKPFLREDETMLSISRMFPDDDAQWHAMADQRGVPRYALSCQLYQRSADVFLGVPFNIASYALLMVMVAKAVNMVPGEFIWTGGDTHLYLNHLEQARLQLSREPRPLPTLRLNSQRTSLFDFTYEDVTLEGYDPHPAIKAPIAV